jgi:hypothetical protein
MDMEQSSSKTWQMATLVLPVILTGWLTFTLSRSEDKIKQEIESKNQLLTAQLNLATELFKRRFDAYEALYGALISLNEKLLLQTSQQRGRRPHRTESQETAGRFQPADGGFALRARRIEQEERAAFERRRC